MTMPSPDTSAAQEGKMSEFRLGREVKWGTHYGIITEVVPPRSKPTTYEDWYIKKDAAQGFGFLYKRDHESYVVTVYNRNPRLKSKRYWPVVSRLALVTPSPPSAEKEER